jgi:hypothetical protein
LKNPSASFAEALSRDGTAVLCARNHIAANPYTIHGTRWTGYSSTETQLAQWCVDCFRKTLGKLLVRVASGIELSEPMARNMNARGSASSFADDPPDAPSLCGFGWSLCGLDPGWDLRMARASRDDLFDVTFLQKEAERYRSEARETASKQQRDYLMRMASLSETLAANERMCAWLERSIQELIAEQAGTAN